MNTIFGNFIEKTLPNLRDALIKLVVGTNETTMNLEDFKTLMAPEPNYKVYTALVSQTGTDEPLGIDTGSLTIGVTYYIETDSPGMDFTNVGAPNNIAGEYTYFVATGTTPASWGSNEDTENNTLVYNLGAPTVIVLENTIGNIWFTYNGVGNYYVNSNELFTQFKTYYSFLNITDSDTNQKNGLQFISVAEMVIISANGETTVDDLLIMTPIEIRVYN